MDLLLKTNDYIFLFFKNVLIFIRLTWLIITKPSRILRYLSKKNYYTDFHPKPGLYFATNVLLAVLVPLIAALPTDIEKNSKEVLTISFSKIRIAL